MCFFFCVGNSDKLLFFIEFNVLLWDQVYVLTYFFLYYTKLCTCRCVYPIYCRSEGNTEPFLRYCHLPYIPYILESNLHSIFGDFLNGKKLVRGSNPHPSFNRPLTTGRLIE